VIAGINTKKRPANRQGVFVFGEWFSRLTQCFIEDTKNEDQEPSST